MDVPTLRLNLIARQKLLEVRAQRTAQQVVLGRDRLQELEKAAQIAQGALENHAQTMAEIAKVAAGGASIAAAPAEAVRQE